ncbi:DNA-directed RNA polymerase I subunit RPA43-like [Anopheles albimanus]|uniref:RPA43 OB domain-containing protein n=1 Tax=Anopheles albimanus TaxID=7167 RepID=A0A182FTW7_ANOAL|nr:DNA-directed RNA polymerase I subunit RPA43-like [Anopheles albimanus]
MHRSTIAKFTKFSVEELQRAVCDPLSCVAKVQSNEILGLRPRDCEQITRGVRRCVTDRIGSYHAKVAGIVLGYAKIRIENTMPAFRSDSPYLHVRATIDYFVFRPRVGSTLRGIVNYVSKDFVSAVMFRVFNVTVKLTKPRSVKKGSQISFIVQSCDMKSQLPIIEGELVTIGIKQEPTEPGETAISPVAGATTKVAEKRPQSTEQDTEERPVPKKAKMSIKQEAQPSEPTAANGLPEEKEPSDDDSVEKSDLIRSLMANVLGKFGKSKNKKKSKKSKDNASSSIRDIQEVSLNVDIKKEPSIVTADQSTIIGASTPIVKEEKIASKKRKIRFNLPSEDTLTPIKTEHRNGGVALQNGKNGI